MIRSRRAFLIGLGAGLLLRVAALPMPGTGDVAIWKAWAMGASADFTAVYGVGGSPPERRVFDWNGRPMTVDYPPVALAELGAVGHVYRTARPAFDDSTLLTVLVKLPGMLAEIVLTIAIYVAGRRWVSESAARMAALASWLNPGVLLDASVLGYLDALMAVPLALSVLCLWRERYALAGVLAAVAVLTKPQAVFAGPVLLAIAIVRSGGRARAIAALSAAASLTGAAAILPFVVRGAWDNVVQALGRVATHDMLSAQAANVWWIVTWALRVQDVWVEWGWWRSLTQEVRILAISRFIALGYPNARVVGLVIVGALIAWGCWHARRLKTAADAAALAAWSLYAYALFAAQVHENHLATALFVLAPATLDRRYRASFWLLSIVVALNLYLFYGLGSGWPSIVPRSITVIDATVVLSAINIGVFAWLTRVLEGSDLNPTSHAS